MAANIRCIMRAKAPYGQGITKLKVKLTPEQSSTPSLMPETNTVYRSRPTEGTGELMKLVGGTVAWNQLCNSSSVTGTSGHKFYLKKSGAESITNTNTFTDLASGTDMVTDLTLALGSTLADYVYSLEQSQAGSGIAWLKKYDLIDDQYHAYSQGSLESVNASAHVMVGKNLLDDRNYTSNVWNIFGIPNTLKPNTTYTFSIHGSTAASWALWLNNSQTTASTTTRLASYTGAGSHLTFTTPGEMEENWLLIGANTIQSENILINDVLPQIELGSTATTYEPYTETTYPLDSDLVLRGIPKLNNGNLYYDGDTYEWDGTVRRKFAEVDLGSLTWTKANTSSGHWRFFIALPIKGTGSNSTKFKGVCTKYIGITPNESYTGVTGITANGADGTLFVCDETYSDQNDFKTAMSGVYLVYELIESAQTTESADPFTAVQTVEDGGTEEFVTTNGVPVGVVGRFANAVPMDGVDSFTVTADDGTTHTYPVTLSEEIYRGYVDMLTGEAVSDMASIAEYNGETISEPWLSSLDVYSAGATPTNGAQVVYPITPEEVTATITGDPSTLSGVVSATSTEGTVEWSELSEIGIKCIMKRKNPFQ